VQAVRPARAVGAVVPVTKRKFWTAVMRAVLTPASLKLWAALTEAVTVSPARMVWKLEAGRPVRLWLMKTPSNGSTLPAVYIISLDV